MLPQQLCHQSGVQPGGASGAVKTTRAGRRWGTVSLCFLPASGQQEVLSKGAVTLLVKGGVLPKGSSQDAWVWTQTLRGVSKGEISKEQQLLQSACYLWISWEQYKYSKTRAPLCPHLLLSNLCWKDWSVNKVLVTDFNLLGVWFAVTLLYGSSTVRSSNECIHFTHLRPFSLPVQWQGAVHWEYNSLFITAPERPFLALHSWNAALPILLASFPVLLLSRVKKNWRKSPRCYLPVPGIIDWCSWNSYTHIWLSRAAYTHAGSWSNLNIPVWPHRHM